MTDQQEKALAFAALHVKGRPLVLHNVWDAGSAKAVADGGATAIATGSWAVAAAQGYGDGQELPLADVIRTAQQIVNAVDVPVSVDFEGGYAVAPNDVAENLRGLLGTGIIGINFEDQNIGGKGLHDMAEQVARIAAMRQVADAAGVPLFINARTDVFFQDSNTPHADLMEDAVARAKAYADAGASGVFVPGLNNADLIAQFCVAQPLPTNIMRMGDTLDITKLAACDVARISHGPGPYIAAMQALTQFGTNVGR